MPWVRAPSPAFLRHMKYYFCDELNNVLSCFHDRIMSCCSGQIGPVYYEAYRGQKIDWNKFREIKYKAFELLNEKYIENSPCKNCFFLRERKDTDVISPKFKLINVSHWTQCNCGCIYCARMIDSKGEISHKAQKSQYYDFLPLLKELYKQELLDRENLTAFIQGGDISVLKEFEPMVKEFLKQGVKDFYILSNNIKYQPVIKKLLDKNMVHYVTALDCANRELYYKLKRVDKFNETVKNLRRYAKSKHKDKVHVKYIIIEHFNDNKEEITDFINLMCDIGISAVEFMIDNKYLLFTDLDKTPLPAHYKELYLHFEKLCKENNLNMVFWDKTRYVINKYLLEETQI